MHLDVHPVGSSPTSPIGGGDSPLNNMFVPHLLACAGVGTIGAVAEWVYAVVVWRVVGGVVEHCLLIEKISTPREAKQLPWVQVRILSVSTPENLFDSGEGKPKKVERFVTLDVLNPWGTSRRDSLNWLQTERRIYSRERPATASIV